MKKFIPFIAVAMFAVAGCGKDEMTGTATVAGSDYEIKLAEAYWWWDTDNWSNVELMLYTSYYEKEGDYYGDYFYIDLYWDGEVRDWLREGTYTLGDDVLDCVEFDYDDDTVQDISAEQGTLTISETKNGYDIVFSGTDTEGRPMEFNYSGPLNFSPM